MDFPGITDISKPHAAILFSKAPGLTPLVGMASGAIVEHLDIVQDVGPRQVAGFVDALADTLLLQAAEEGFGNGIAPAIATPAHAEHESMRLAEPLPLIATVKTRGDPYTPLLA